MRLIAVLLALSFVSGCRSSETQAFLIDVNHINDDMYQEILAYIEAYGFTEKTIAGLKHDRIQVIQTPSGEIWTSRYESETAYISLLNLVSNKRLSMDFVLKNNTYNYTLEHRRFLGGYCELIKDNVKPGTEIRFVDYEPDRELPVCHGLMEKGLALFENVNNES